jgi:hypothetical protein
MKKESKNKLWIVTFFAISMAFLETTVVIYLRKMYYPNGFNFPLAGFVDPTILGIEWIREFATVIMLITIAMLAAKKFYERLAYFIYAFAIWDIFYYIYLKLFLDWPASILTWDVLFLIPWPWAGPVLAPLICSALFIAMTFIIINSEDSNIKVRISLKEGALMVSGILLILYTWLYDYGKLIIGSGNIKNFFTLNNNEEFMQIIMSYVPQYYNWPVFIIGTILLSVGVLIFYSRTNKKLFYRK